MSDVIEAVLWNEEALKDPRCQAVLQGVEVVAGWAKDELIGKFEISDIASIMLNLASEVVARTLVSWAEPEQWRNIVENIVAEPSIVRATMRVSENPGEKQ